MAISKLARVRVDAFSNTMPSTRPGRVACGVRALRRARSSSARAEQRLDAARLAGRRRPGIVSVSSVGHRASSSTASRISIASSISPLRDDQRRHQPHDVAARDRDQQAARARLGHQVRRIDVDHQPLQQTRARARRASWAAGARPGAAATSRGGCPPRARDPAGPSSSMACWMYSAAAVANGLPPKVDAWVPGSKPRPTSSLASMAPMGMPPASPLASVTTSGTTPSLSKA